MSAHRLKRLRNRILRRVLELGQRAGVDILPHHFYSPVPDLAALRRQIRWRERGTMTGVNGADPDQQLLFLEEWCIPELRAEVSRRNIHAEACALNGAQGFGPIEADLLFCFVASRRPSRIVQVGAGVSTAVILAAAHYAGYKPEVICVDPFPTKFLVEAAREDEITLVSEPAQDVPISLLSGVGSSGLLFIDSTHTVKPGSEVNRLILEVLPRLSAGSFVHFHDIFFPFDYPRGLLADELFFWNESPLLHAFLVGNHRFTIRVSMSMLHYDRPQELKILLPNYEPQANDSGLGVGRGHFPASTYLEVVA